jgi:hypothetical protein
MFIALVALFFLSCVLAFLTPFALMAVYDMFRPLGFLSEFPFNMLEKMLIFPMLLIGAGAGATVTQLVRWSLADAADIRWFYGVEPVLTSWGIASVALPIMMFQLRSSYPDQPLIGIVLLALAGGYTGYLIGRRQQQPALRSGVSQKTWTLAMIVTWGIAWACVPGVIEAYVDRL